MARRHRRPADDLHRITTTLADDGTSILLSISWPGRHHEIALPLGVAYEVGSGLLVLVHGALAGEKRPWDDDPGRVPFASRGRRGGASEAAPAASGAVGERRGGRQAAGIRPTGRVESGA